MKLLTLSSCSLLLATCLGASAASISLNPNADTYTRPGHNAGSDSVLNIYGQGGSDFMAYIRFDLASSLPVGATIDSASLTLYYEPASRSDTITTGRFGNFGLLNVTGNTPQNWDEATLAEGNEGQEYGGTFASLNVGVTNGWLYNLDADSGANVTETLGGSSAGDAETLSGPDLVSFLNGQLAGSGSATIISAINAENGRGYGYASKDNSDSSLWPTLSLTYTVVPEPSSLALLGLGLFGLFTRRFRKN